MDVQAFAKLLPTFYGNSDHLEHFINSVDDFYINQAEKSVIITLISNSPDVVKNQLLTTSPNFHT